jgi:hypothetical protein
LSVQTVQDLIERGRLVLTGAGGPKRPARGPGDHLHPVVALDARIVLLAELDLHPGDPRIDPLELRELVLGESLDGLRETAVPALQDEIQRGSLPSEDERGRDRSRPLKHDAHPADLVFAPTPACRRFARRADLRRRTYL